ncbi:MAG: flagellar assembly protein FliW [Campylobacterales bacterium]|nr:flagellar assembly protein FliW [Campylobacterales bacterium]
MKFNMRVPLLGFENLKEMELKKIDEIFMKLQSCDDDHISFTLINPFVLREYDFEIPDKVRDILDIDEKSNLLILNIVLTQTPIEDSAVNFVGPLVFNVDNQRAAQVILPDNSKYGVAEKISSFLNR